MPRRRYVTRPRFAPVLAEPAAQRELVAVREITHALLRADRPEDVFQFALDRVSPVVGATAASVYLVDGASELMRLVAAHNWPERLRPWLGAMRVRAGFGPSGEAASERRAIEIPDVLADPDLEDWHEVARELDFRAIVALPLQAAGRVLGTVTFYFREPGGIAPEKRGILRTVADQMAAAAEKVELLDEMRRVNASLVEANAELERQYAAVIEARRAKDELVDSLIELSALRRGALEVVLDEFDAHGPLREAVRITKAPPDGVQLIVEEPDSALPVLRSDRRRITRILANLLSNAFNFTVRGEVFASVRVANDKIVYSVTDTGIGIEPAAQLIVFDEFRQVDGTATRRYGGSGMGLALARGMARLLRGDIELVSAPGEGSTFTLTLPLEYAPSGDRP
jgi:signal transduction histidine kinase